jgi:hypothetical protein
MKEHPRPKGDAQPLGRPTGVAEDGDRAGVVRQHGHDQPDRRAAVFIIPRQPTCGSQAEQGRPGNSTNRHLDGCRDRRAEEQRHRHRGHYRQSQARTNLDHCCHKEEVLGSHTSTRISALDFE